MKTLGRHEEALACFDRVLALDPKDVNAWSSKGVVFVYSGRYREALACFTKALEIDPYLEPAKQGIAICRQDLDRE